MNRLAQMAPGISWDFLDFHAARGVALE